ncbi:excisionase family DNA-binding protein [Luteibacter anthropi]|uniref:Excisionase family DNA-binding protein n=1 Tax=Luteibacter anthropi TaxID=564369 RepID=A0A7X5U720_9GAMM|nr:excisionase family DNA-binding protein [Luteibacter anthropi]NII05098.1 excisionase family DNA-binding protein [Luteibacter anthropi]URX63913.1 excisionase family DNA-binding protein [Luteibacter anthropi]
MAKSDVTHHSTDPSITTGEAARLLGISISTAQKWIESGALESWKTPGGHRRMHRSAVLALLDERTARASEGGSPSSAELRPHRSPAYPAPADEAGRLRAVGRTGLLDTPPEASFDRITWLAAQLTGAPVALLSLLTAHRQWVKSRFGSDLAETPREWAFCSHAIMGSAALEIEDARQDVRVRDNPMVTGAPHIRFYSGLPLHTPDGHAVGTLCILDWRPRRLSEVQATGMRALAALAEDEIRLYMAERGRR